MATDTDFETVAAQLIDDELGPSGVSRIPSAVYDWCISQVAKRVEEIESLPNGVVQYGVDGQVSFMSGDPLKPVQAILNKYKGLGAVG